MLTLDDILNFLGHDIFDRTLSIILLSVAVYLLYRWVFEPVSTIVKGVLTFWSARKAPATYLEITPPKHSEKSLLATQQLFTVLQQTIGRSKTASAGLSGWFPQPIEMITAMKTMEAFKSFMKQNYWIMTIFLHFQRRLRISLDPFN